MLTHAGLYAGNALLSFLEAFVSNVRQWLLKNSDTSRPCHLRVFLTDADFCLSKTPLGVSSV